MSRVMKLTVEYDGTDFYGWQIQPNHRTVQGEIEKALGSLTQQMIRITASGRTDTGVHALGQVISFSYDGNLETKIFQNGLNALLPSDVRIRNAEEAPHHFNARRHATRRIYRYIIAKSERAIGRQYAWFPGFQYNLELMRQASSLLLGKHNWHAFAKADPNYKSMESTVFDIQWYDYDTELHFEIAAVRFFHSMIRFIVGTLMDVGRGNIPPERIYEMLCSSNLYKSETKAPANGLFLLKVEYA